MMKKFLVIATLGVAGLVSAKNSELKLNSVNACKDNFLKIEKITNTFGELEWHYLYQSTCGWTFNMTSDIGIQNMTDDQYEDYMDEVIAMNDQICKLHGEKPVTNFTFDQLYKSNVKERV